MGLYRQLYHSEISPNHSPIKDSWTILGYVFLTRRNVVTTPHFQTIIYIVFVRYLFSESPSEDMSERQILINSSI